MVFQDLSRVQVLPDRDEGQAKVKAVKEKGKDMIAAAICVVSLFVIGLALYMRFDSKAKALNSRIDEMALSFELSNIRAADYRAYEDDLHKSAVERMDVLDRKLNAVVDSMGKRFDHTEYKPAEDPKIVLVPKGKKVRKVVETAYERDCRERQERMYQQQIMYANSANGITAWHRQSLYGV